MAKPGWIDELKSVAKDANGLPVFLSPYGFAIQEINGKKYVASNTLEDYRKLREKCGPDLLPGSRTRAWLREWPSIGGRMRKSKFTDE